MENELCYRCGASLVEDIQEEDNQEGGVGIIQDHTGLHYVCFECYTKVKNSRKLA